MSMEVSCYSLRLYEERGQGTIVPVFSNVLGSLCSPSIPPLDADIKRNVPTLTHKESHSSNITR